MTESEAREKMVAFARSLFERGLSGGSSGNMSVRLGDGWLLTPTNSSMGTLQAETLSRVDGNWRHVDGDPPTKEVFLHRAMYEARASAGAVVHLHSTHAVAVSCLADINRADVLPALTPYFVMRIGRLPLVPYHRPGDETLAEPVRELAREHTAVLLANHGPVVAAKSLEAAVSASEELEESARLFLLLQNGETRSLDFAQVKELRERFPIP